MLRRNRVVAFVVSLALLAPASLAAGQPVPDAERIPVDVRRTTLLVRDIDRALAFWRDALGLKTRIIGVVSEHADWYAQSLAAGRPIETATANTFADGMAVRVPVPAALDIIRAGAERIVRVSDREVKAAVGHYFSDTHNLVEGAGALPNWAA